MTSFAGFVRGTMTELARGRYLMPRRVTSRSTVAYRAPARSRPSVAARGVDPHIAAASGIASVGDVRYVIADDQCHVGVFPRRGSAPGRLLRVRAGRLPLGHKARKRRKPDFEAITVLPAFEGFPAGALLLLPSGSRPTRCSGALLPLASDGSVAGAARSVDMRGLYRAIGNAFPLSTSRGRSSTVPISHSCSARTRGARSTRGSASRCVPSCTPSPSAGHRRAMRCSTCFPSLSVRSATFRSGSPTRRRSRRAASRSPPSPRQRTTRTTTRHVSAPRSASSIATTGSSSNGVFEPPLKVEGIDVVASRGRIRLDVVTDADDANEAARLLTTTLVR